MISCHCLTYLQVEIVVIVASCYPIGANSKDQGDHQEELLCNHSDVDQHKDYTVAQ